MSIFDCFNTPDRSDSLDSPLINADPLCAPTPRQRATEVVQRGDTADDRACREQRWLGWLCWLVAYGRLGGMTDGD